MLDVQANERDEKMTTTTERIAELTAAWEDAVNYGELPEYHARASDYTLSEDDWGAGLNDDEAAEIVALIERQAENQKHAERIARQIGKERNLPGWTMREDAPGGASAFALMTAAALQALIETENN